MGTIHVAFDRQRTRLGVGASMTHWRHGRIASGGQPRSGLHISADTRAEANSLARHLPPGGPNLTVVRGSPFYSERELHPIEPLDAGFDHREFAVYILLSAFGISVGVLLAAATALLDWSY